MAISPESMAPAVRSVLLIAVTMRTGAPRIERGLRLRDQAAVEDVVDLVILRLALADGDARPARAA